MRVWNYTLSSCMRMELSAKSLALIVFFILVHDAVCSHFRGGTFTYKPVNPSDPANTRISLFVKCCVLESSEVPFSDFWVKQFHVRWLFIHSYWFGQWKWAQNQLKIATIMIQLISRSLRLFVNPLWWTPSSQGWLIRRRNILRSETLNH